MQKTKKEVRLYDPSTNKYLSGINKQDNNNPPTVKWSHEKYLAMHAKTIEKLTANIFNNCFRYRLPNQDLINYVFNCIKRCVFKTDEVCIEYKELDDVSINQINDPILLFKLKHNILLSSPTIKHIEQINTTPIALIEWSKIKVQSPCFLPLPFLAVDTNHINELKKKKPTNTKHFSSGFSLIFDKKDLVFLKTTYNEKIEHTTIFE